MAILITGGTGFFGRYLARLLLQRSEGPVVLYSPSPNRQAIADIEDQVEIVAGDCAEPFELLRAVDEYGVTDIFHMAYMVAEADRVPSRAIRVNILGTQTVFEVAVRAGIRRVVWSSSASIHPSVKTSPNPEVIDEGVPPAPESVYGACKLFNEQIAENYRRRFGLDHVALRPTSVFGLGRAQRKGGGGGIYAGLIERTVAGEKYSLPPPDHRLMWAYVLDCAEAFYHLWKAENLRHRFFYFGGRAYSVAETADTLRALLPDARLEFGAEPTTIVPFVSTRLLEEETGYRPRYDLASAFADYIDRLRSRLA